MSEGPISSEQMWGLLASWEITRRGVFLDEQCAALTARLNTLIAPLIQAARVNAATEMRQRCAQESEEPICHEASCPIHNGGDTCDCAVGDLTDSIRALPLAPQDEAWLRRVVEVAFDAGFNYQRDAQLMEIGAARNMEIPVRPTYESILAEAAKS